MIEATLVFTPAALDAFLSTLSSDDLNDFAIPSEARDLITSVRTEHGYFIVHASDTMSSARVVFGYKGCVDRLQTSPELMLVAFQRAARLVISSRSFPVRLPPAWSAYHAGNLVAFFATNRGRQMGPLRWVAQLHPQGSQDIYFCRVTDSSEPVVLEQFHPLQREYRTSVDGWTDAFEQTRKRFRHRELGASQPQVVATVDLEATTFGAVVGNLAYSGWLERLTEDQKRFLEGSRDASVKLRGPAGSGKTLLLELKALYETYSALEPEAVPKILFVTHSWAMAEQVDAGLWRLNDRDASLDNISVAPLLSIAEELLPAGRGTQGYDLLGEDNLDGKMLQLSEIAAIAEDVATRDWLAYEARSTPEFASRATADADSAEKQAFVWDLMQEFACVLSANGILPGVNAARVYLPMQRMPWMMPLATDGEKLFVLQVYTELVDRMRDARLLTTDQLINDFLNYLETFAWNIRRRDSGFDLIFVDELHLFNEQERLSLSFLSRDAGAFPTMFMALDPRQSPSEIYTGTHLATASAGESGEADAFLGDVKAIDLRTVHRFSPEILNLVRVINNMYPALELADDWHLDANRLDSSVPSDGVVPALTTHTDQAEEIQRVAEEAGELLAYRSGDERVAVVLLDPLALDAYDNFTVKGASILRLLGRDDVDALQYSKRAVVLSPAEYVAGLQFTSVIVAGFPHMESRRANLGHQKRRLLSLLYLAVTRATHNVSIHINLQDGAIPDVLETATKLGALTLGEI